MDSESVVGLAALCGAIGAGVIKGLDIAIVRLRNHRDNGNRSAFDLRRCEEHAKSIAETRAMTKGLHSVITEGFRRVESRIGSLEEYVREEKHGT